MTASFPPALADAIERLAHERTGLVERAGALSRGYRDKRPSTETVRGSDDAVAYALSRMPATFAAVSTVLEELAARAEGFRPTSLLDIGSGPGTAAWAALEVFPDLPHITLADHSTPFLDLSARLAEGSVLAGAKRVRADMTGVELGEQRADLVTVAYALTELADAALLPAVERFWAATGDALVIVEPGRPRDYARLMTARMRLIELGATILGPCPHDGACPLPEGDWCHFSVRLPRSREHMRLKGATLGYEDEKFSYLVAARPGLGTSAPTRVVRWPEISKFAVTLPLCTPQGLERRQVLKRDGAAFKAARKLDWGDVGI